MSKLLENVRVASTALMSNKFRALLTTLGIAIGIAAVVILVSLGQAVQTYVTNQFLSVGSDLIYVRPATSFRGPGFEVGRGGGQLSSLTEKDVALLQDPFNVPAVKAVVPVINIGRPVYNGSNTERVNVSATTALYFEVMNRQAASGRLFDDQDLLSASRVAVIGQTTARNLFPGNADPIGNEIRIGQVSFRVIGILELFGSSGFGQDQDDVVFVPITAAELHLASERQISGQLPVSLIYIEAANINAIDSIVAATTELLRTQHKIKAGKDDDFQITAQKDLINNFDQVITTLTIFLAVIGGISLVVGGIGVMNIMLVTVTERTREIGLRKAVGARGWDVLLQFLTEAVFLCGIGGAAGLLLATMVTNIVSALVPDLSPVVSVVGVALAVGVTTLIGVFFGLYPASRAAALNPIQALRTE
jgi:putative ABC transport system permease protein